MKLTNLIPDFMTALEAQLKSDEKRHGEKWKEMPREGQEQRIYDRFHAYLYDFKVKGIAIPWLKIAGLALIGWTRDKYAAKAGPEEVGNPADEEKKGSEAFQHLDNFKTEPE